MRKNKKGKLTVIGGPMFAGKTTKLLAIYNVLTNLKQPVICFKSEVEGNGGIGHTNSHDEKLLPVIFINPAKPEKILKHIEKEGVKNVIIDAIHFFPRTKFIKVVNKLLDWDVHVFVNGLIYDYRKKRYGATLDLFKKANEKIKLYSVCVRCASKAAHTERIAGSSKQSISTKKAKYIPVCTICHQIFRG